MSNENCISASGTRAGLPLVAVSAAASGAAVALADSDEGELAGAAVVAGALRGRSMPRARPCSTADSSFCSAIGFSRKFSAPILVASTAVSMVAWPDIMMTGMVSWPCADHSLSRLTPSVSGIQISSSTRSGVPAARYSRACCAFSASSTTWPSSLRISESSSRIPISSSTTRMVAILPLLTPPQRSGTGSPKVDYASLTNRIEICAPTTSAPSMRLRSSMRAPCSSMIFFTIASPRPVPLALVVT
ncbi:hypothetical protein D9M69_429140 [compost metagenome]